MPNRILREGILTSERIAALTWQEEVFYRRLMSVVDDFGRYHANPKLLRAACYPLLIDKVSDADIGKWLTSCVTAALVSVYPAPDGKRYLQLLDFRQQTRAEKSKYPPVPINCVADAKHPIADAHLYGDGDGDVKPPHPPAGGAGFSDFWKAWPTHARKVAREQCEKKWLTKGCAPIAEQVIAAVVAAKQSEAWTKDRGDFIPSPLVWLNQARWEANSEVAEAWHETAGGIKAKGVTLGIPYTSDDECKPFVAYRARVFMAAGHRSQEAA